MPTHYETLGVPPTASDTQIREAYRRLARDHHPDRSASSTERPSARSGGVSMPDINEAYRVLGDPGRRVVYDAKLRSSSPVRESPGTPRTGDQRSSRSAQSTGTPMHPSHLEPARFPWRGTLFVGALGVIAVVVLAQFVEPGPPPGPDGILRIGDCVAIEANNDAREVSCTDDPTVDLVVEVIVPFDGSCPGSSSPHRDRQGMGVACVTDPDG